LCCVTCVCSVFCFELIAYLTHSRFLTAVVRKHAREKSYSFVFRCSYRLSVLFLSGLFCGICVTSFTCFSLFSCFFFSSSQVQVLSVGSVVIRIIIPSRVVSACSVAIQKCNRFLFFGFFEFVRNKNVMKSRFLSSLVQIGLLTVIVLLTYNCVETVGRVCSVGYSS
jgi:hypothetical protein